MRDRSLRASGALAAVLALGAPVLAASAQQDDAGPAEAAQMLTAEQRAAGWRLLFDGSTLAGWRSLDSDAPPPGWKAGGGVLVRESSGGDLLTVAQFDDFELELEWRLEEGGNSGIMFRVTTEADETWLTGPEIQLLDNDRHPDGRNPLTAAGSNYALHAPVRDVTRPVGEWNEVRLLVRGAHVEHWLNGVKVVEYDLWSPDWEARVAASKFRAVTDYGRARRGHIAFQDHGDFVGFRNIRIRPL
jgi:hypothetical protein